MLICFCNSNACTNIQCFFNIPRILIILQFYEVFSYEKMVALVLSILIIFSISPVSALSLLSVSDEPTTINIGDCIVLGTYYNEPIIWRCADIDENGPLMLSEKILCLKAFDAKGEDDYYHLFVLLYYA